MSSVNQNNTGGGDSDLIVFETYYDENGNPVSETGYLLDEDGNLVVSADSTLTAAYTVTAADGTVYTVGEDATLVNNMILSTVDNSMGTTTVDTYGNEVDASGYLIDQADSEGGLLSVTASEFTITQQDVVETTDADGNTITLVDGSNATFTDTGTTSGNVYVAVSTNETYYDVNGNTVTSSSDSTYLGSADGTLYSTTAVTEGTVYSDTAAGVYYVATATADGSSTYYLQASGDVSYLYLDGTQLTAGSEVYYDGTTNYYLLGTETVTVTATQGAGVVSYLSSSYTTGSYDSDDLVVPVGTSTYYIVSEDLSNEVIGNTSTYYISLFTDLSAGTYTISSYKASAFSEYSTSASYYYWDGSSLYLLDSTSDTYAVSTSLSVSLGSGYVSASAIFTSAGTSGTIADASSTAFTNASGTTVSVTVTQASTLEGWQLLYDSNDYWVSLSDSTGSTYYLAASAASDATTLTTTATVTSAFYTTYNGSEYFTVSSSDGSGNYESFIATYSYSEYADDNGLTTDADGYLVDDEGEKLVFTYETSYVYAQEGYYWDEDGYDSDVTVTYYYYFASTTATDYYGESTLVEENGSDYYVQTNVMTTLYYDSYGNALNASGYIVDPTTGNIVTVSSTAEIKAGYSFTSLNGITYVVSGTATIDATTGIVYSGVAETRYYGDDNENETLDSSDTEYTSDALWIIIRNEEDEITSYKSVSSGTTLTAAEWEEQYGTTATA